jgi:transposase-like protein
LQKNCRTHKAHPHRIGGAEAEADVLCGAQRYERSPERVDTRARHYERQLHTKATLQVPRLRTLPFETQIIERYRVASRASRRR